MAIGFEATPEFLGRRVATGFEAGLCASSSALPQAAHSTSWHA
jgi:hypothetical protein